MIFSLTKYSMLICVVFMTALSAQSAARSKGSENSDAKNDLVNRRVLILDFTNIQKNDGTAYLGVSVPEAMIDPLKATKKFEVMPRDKADAAMLKLFIDKTNAISETQAVKIGQETGADVVVVGSFTTVGNVVQLGAKAIEVQTGRIAVAKSKQGKLDVTIFSLIGDLSNEMSADMAKELPPLSQRERIVVNKFTGRIAYDFKLHAQFVAGMAQLKPGNYLQPILGARVDTSFSFVLPFLQPYAEAGYFSAAGKQRVTTMNMFHFAAGLTYSWHFSGFKFIKDIAVAPYLAGGFYAGQISMQFGYIGDAVNYTVASIDTGVHADFFLSRHIAVTLGVSAALLFDAQTPLVMSGISLGAGYRF